MKRILLAALVALGTATAQEVKGCDGKRNLSPVLDIEPNLLGEVANGKKWLMQEGNNIVYLARVSGTAYDMGLAYGKLFKEELAVQLKNVEYMYPSIGHDVLKDFILPESLWFVLDYLTNDQFLEIAHLLLDINWQITLPWIPQRFVDEIQGIADGAGVGVSLIQRVNILPELTQAHCTVLGAWGSATAGNKLLHLRALDWDAFAPVNQFPTIIMYEPNEGNSFTNIGYLSLIGTLTSMSKIGITAGEKVMNVDNPKDYPLDPEITHFGKPWMFVLRDTVQFSNNIYDVENILSSADRTMKIHAGFGSYPDNTFRGVDYASNFVYFYDDKNYTHYDPVSHPQLNGTFYYNKHMQPNKDECIANILKEKYGEITAETLFRDITGLEETGDNKWVVMDPETQEIWAAWSQFNTEINAYERSPIHVRLNDFWSTSQ